jgi:hypothetical protein
LNHFVIVADVRLTIDHHCSVESTITNLDQA